MVQGPKEGSACYESRPSVYVMCSQKNFISRTEGIYITQLGDKLPAHRRAVSKHAAAAFHLSDPLQLNGIPAKETGTPVTHASQPLTLFTRPSHCEMSFQWAAIVRERLLISNFKYFKTLHIARRDCMASIYMHLGLAKDDER